MSHAIIDSTDPLERLADHCLDARELIDETGTEAMRPLIDLLLLEIGRALVRKTGLRHEFETREQP